MLDMTPPSIRPAAPADAEALADLHLDVWDEAYAGLIDDELLRERRRGRERLVGWWQQAVAGGSSPTLVACTDDGARLLGFVSAGPGRDEGAGSDLPSTEVAALNIRSEAYGRGVGYALLTAAIGSAPAYLWVLEGNDRAIAFYERQGFRFDGVTKEDPAGVERRMVRTGESA